MACPDIIIPVEIHIKKLPDIEGSLPIYSYVVHSVIIRTDMNLNDKPSDKINIIQTLKNKINRKR